MRWPREVVHRRWLNALSKSPLRICSEESSRERHRVELDVLVGARAESGGQDGRTWRFRRARGTFVVSSRSSSKFQTTMRSESSFSAGQCQKLGAEALFLRSRGTYLRILLRGAPAAATWVCLFRQPNKHVSTVTRNFGTRITLVLHPRILKLSLLQATIVRRALPRSHFLYGETQFARLLPSIRNTGRGALVSPCRFKFGGISGRQSRNTSGIGASRRGVRVNTPSPSDLAGTRWYVACPKCAVVGDLYIAGTGWAWISGLWT